MVVRPGSRWSYGAAVASAIFCLTSTAPGLPALWPAPASATDDTLPEPLGSFRALSSTEWLVDIDDTTSPYVLPGQSELGLLQAFRNPKVERAHPAYTFRDGSYGPGAWLREESLIWSPTGCETESGAPAPAEARRHSVLRTPFGSTADPALALSVSARVMPDALSGIPLEPTWAIDASPAPALELIGAERAKVCAVWERVRPVTLVRFENESDTLSLLQCDGSVASDALDRVSVMTRPPGVARPELPLPLEPDADTENGEWVDGVRLVHPRMLWVLQQIANEFPYRHIYIVSGYRSESTSSMHYRGRALDLSVYGVAKEELFRFCRTLSDVGCGYYPKHDFVHVDVRPFGSRHPMWVDASEPGEPSRYVDSWPSVVEGGALAWAGSH